MPARQAADELRCGTSCVRCGRFLIAPVWSAYVNEQFVRHEWFCSDCDLSITSAVSNHRSAVTSVRHLPVEQISAQPHTDRHFSEATRRTRFFPHVGFQIDHQGDTPSFSLAVTVAVEIIRRRGIGAGK